MDKKLFTTESVTEGHPDKVCDQISDAILDDILAADPAARVACEVIAATGMVLVFGEITTTHYCDIPAVVRRTVKNIGYDNPALGFDAATCSVLSAINEQSPDIARGVNSSLETRSGNSDSYDKIGAGDQGMVFGFASDETEEFLPLGLTLSHSLAKQLSAVRKSGEIKGLRPDGKTQVTVEYHGNEIARIDTVLISAQHSPETKMDWLANELTEKVIKKIIPAKYADKNMRILTNPTGRFEVGGPVGDSGLTGRKIIVDSYGGYAPHGGGAFSGKDPTKMDRSAAYYARYICKNIVAAGLAKKCELQISYAIGVAHPVSVAVNTFGTSKVSETELIKIINKHFDMRPAAIIEELNLRRPIYLRTAAYGHFGKPEFPWEQLDKAKKL